MEVVWDLDTELREKTEELGIPMVRSATVGNTPAFTRMIVDLVEELTQGRDPERLGTLPGGMDEETYHLDSRVVPAGGPQREARGA